MRTDIYAGEDKPELLHTGVPGTGPQKSDLKEAVWE